MKKGTLVEVSWFDAWEDFDYDATRVDYPVLTVGWLIRKKPVVSVASERLEAGGGWRGVTNIPPDLVRSIRSLAEGPRSKGEQ